MHSLCSYMCHKQLQTSKCSDFSKRRYFLHNSTPQKIQRLILSSPSSPISRRPDAHNILAKCKLTNYSQREERRREMGVLKLYGLAASTCTARVLLCLEEVGAEYELVTINMATGEHKGPAHLARNPFGQIPALEDGDLVLFESRAISRYVLRKYKANGTDLLKEDNLSESALVNVWLEVEAQQYNPAISPIVFQSFILPKMRGGEPDQAIIDASLEKFKKVLEVYEARLSKSKYLAGDFFSMADLSHFSYTKYLMATPYGSVFESYPHVKAWWDDITSRPAFKKVAASMLGS